MTNHWGACICEMSPLCAVIMETFSALLAICVGNSPVPGEFPAQRPVTRNFDVFFNLRLNKCLSKQSWGRWFETLLRPLWHHRNVMKCWGLLIHLCQWSCSLFIHIMACQLGANPDSKIHGANMGPTWVLSAPDGPHVGAMNLAIREAISWKMLTYLPAENSYSLFYFFYLKMLCTEWWHIFILMT